MESRKHLRFTEDDRARLEQNLRLAEKLGGETAVIEGAGSLDEDILTFARDRNITKLVRASPPVPAGWNWWLGSTVDDLIRHAGTSTST